MNSTIFESRKQELIALVTPWCRKHGILNAHEWVTDISIVTGKAALPTDDEERLLAIPIRTLELPRNLKGALRSFITVGQLVRALEPEVKESFYMGPSCWKSLKAFMKANKLHFGTVAPISEREKDAVLRARAGDIVAAVHKLFADYLDCEFRTVGDLVKAFPKELAEGLEEHFAFARRMGSENIFSWKTVPEAVEFLRNQLKKHGIDVPA